MAETTFEELLADALQAKSVEVRTIALRIQKNWIQGVTPSRSDLLKLRGAVQSTRGCARLQDDGRCDTWLRRHGAAEGVKAHPPYTCPFASSDPKVESRFTQCPGYRAG